LASILGFNSGAYLLVLTNIVGCAKATLKSN